MTPNELFDKLDAPTAAAEGGYANNLLDRGGETNFGITIGEARDNGYMGRMIDMTAAQAKQIRKTKYFLKTGIYTIGGMNEAVAKEVYDSGILSGTSVAVKWFQRALNAVNRHAKDYADIEVDGVIGSQTNTAFAAYLKRNGAKAESRMLKALNVLQGCFFFSITENREANEEFLNGWLDNRVVV